MPPKPGHRCHAAPRRYVLKHFGSATAFLLPAVRVYHCRNLRGTSNVLQVRSVVSAPEQALAAVSSDPPNSLAADEAGRKLPVGEGPPEQESSDALILALFMAAMPVAALVGVVVPRIATLEWHGLLSWYFLQLASATLTGLIAHWLHREARRRLHPGLLMLAIGFAFEAVLLYWSAFEMHPGPNNWLEMATMVWAGVFCASAVVVMAWAGTRRWIRKIQVRSRRWFWVVGTLIFLATVVASR
jgi:hypothetical protein